MPLATMRPQHVPASVATGLFENSRQSVSKIDRLPLPIVRLPKRLEFRRGDLDTILLHHILLFEPTYLLLLAIHLIIGLWIFQMEVVVAYVLPASIWVEEVGHEIKSGVRGQL